MEFFQMEDFYDGNFYEDNSNMRSYLTELFLQGNDILNNTRSAVYKKHFIRNAKGY